jgi:hypothetical protein
MSDTLHLLRRQAAWQKNRSSLSWPDKIRMVGAMQETLRRLRALKSNCQGSDKEDQAETEERVTQ